ncbi:MAG: ribonuclease P protein component [Bacteroidales bacterium]|jgi:ribonuclease P protein component|nr:ribonuclease P protein component [Bacteroidales bacterium]MBQ4305977.1 ribonuclease P protein component [Bacteroidales bacterium]MBQ5944031.1 ribonuclease P protein component [Bacteroidales bacterium]
MEALIPGLFSLPKAERLSGRTAVSDLFSKGNWGGYGALRYCFRKGNGQDVNRIMVSVPKKFFRRAVKRNLLKRRIRESYRRQKSLVPSSAGIDIAFLYNTKDLLDYRTIYETVGTILKKLGDE